MTLWIILYKDWGRVDHFLTRRPYTWDSELMFSTLFFVWGTFTYKASKNINKYQGFIRFTGWAFFVHAATMIIVGLVNKSWLNHLLLDSIPWAILGTLLLFTKKHD